MRRITITIGAGEVGDPTEIVIRGERASGKTVLAQFIARALMAAGANVGMGSINPNVPRRALENSCRMPLDMLDKQRFSVLEDDR